MVEASMLSGSSASGMGFSLRWQTYYFCAKTSCLPIACSDVLLQASMCSYDRAPISNMPISTIHECSKKGRCALYRSACYVWSL